MRAESAWVLGFMYGSTPEAMMALRKALSEDSEAVVRSKAAASLGELRDKESSPTLRVALRVDKSYLVRVKAAEALSKLKGEEAEANALALCEALRADKLPSVRGQAAEALGEVFAFEAAEFRSGRRQATRNDIAVALLQARQADSSAKVRDAARRSLTYFRRCRLGRPSLSDVACEEIAVAWAHALFRLTVSQTSSLGQDLQEDLHHLRFAENNLFERMLAALQEATLADSSQGRSRRSSRSRSRSAPRR